MGWRLIKTTWFFSSFKQQEIKKGYTSCKISACTLPEMRGGKKSHPSSTEWDEKQDSMNTKDNSSEVWIKKGMKPCGQGKESYCYTILSHPPSALLCVDYMSAITN